MRAAVIGLALGLAAGGAAGADTLETLKANTLVLTDASGATRTLVIEDGGVFTLGRSDGVSSGGAWTIDAAGWFCLTPRGEASLCLPPFPADQAVGDEWDMLGPTGALVYRARIVEGRAQTALTSTDRQPGEGGADH